MVLKSFFANYFSNGQIVSVSVRPVSVYYWQPRLDSLIGHPLGTIIVYHNFRKMQVLELDVIHLISGTRKVPRQPRYFISLATIFSSRFV